MSGSLPNTIRMMRELVALPSVSSADPLLDQPNLGVVERVADWATSVGFDADVQSVDESRGKANLVATLGRGEGGLVLAGHADTVPYDKSGWSQDPFELTEKDDRLHGLGICDMKGFFALALEAASSFTREQLRAPLILVATADEESSMRGARALVAKGKPSARCAVIGEPTNLRPIRKHKGVMMERIRLTGRSGHSSDPSLGVNALDAMYEVIGELIAFRDELRAKHRDDDFAVPNPTLNLGRIFGGDNPNRICASAELHFDLRPVPGMDVASLRHEIDARIRTRLAGTPVKIDFEPLFDGVSPFASASTSDIVRAAESLTGNASGAVAFGTEAPFFDALGIQTVVLGPGDIAVAHQPNEYLPVDRISPTVELLRKLIHRFCVAPEP